MKVSIIILNYNTSRLTLNCINSIHKYLPNGTYEIIVVDNASQETDYQHLTENLSGQEITIIRNKINSGFGAGNMVGANIAQGKYLCFLNNDTELLEDCISPLCSYLKENPQTGCITPQQYNKHLKAVPSFNHPIGILYEILGNDIPERLCPARYPKRKKKVYQFPIHASWINGAFMMFPSEVFFKIKGFDTNIFLYYEEYDICTT